MNLLAPLYVAGALAVALPILFHLIRRTPQGRQEFSSLMFLSPSPPRITRRSRVSNLLLLLLRAAALCLLAFAFARPFLRRSADEGVTQPLGRRVALMVDASASMRRGDLWAQAKKQAERAVAELRPGDQAALFFFDRQVRPAVTFAEWRETPDPARRAALVRGRLEEAAPTWFATRLGECLATVADLLAETEGPAGSGAGASAGRQIVLVSDLQQGGHAEALQGHEWPQNVLLDVRAVAPKPSSNAALQVVRDTPGVTDEVEAAAGAAQPARGSAESRLRVRVTNQPDSAQEQFTLTWADERGPVPGSQPLKVYVPPGRGQTVRVPWPAPGDRQADRLVLGGDESDFDNTLYVVPVQTQTLRVLFVGDDAPDDTKGLLYYLRSAAVDTPRQKVQVESKKTNDTIGDVDLLDARLVVIGSAIGEAQAAKLRRWADSGGTVLWVMKDAAAWPSVRATLGAEPADAVEAPGSNFALLARVDFGHPLFAPFADSRFGDFTKIHFWKHRRVKAEAGAAPAGRVLASFDDGDPFLIENPVGKGRVIVATSGWHPDDSQLALSTKFVPLISGLIRGREADDAEAAQVVGEPVALSATTRPAAPAAPERSPAVVLTPDGRRLDIAGDADAFSAADRPGIYRILHGGRETPVAVNVDSDESRTAPLAPEELEHFGARLGTRPPSDELATRQRQLQIIELENRQKLWRWMILAVLGLLAAETALAGRLARRSALQPVEPGPQVVTT